MGLPQTFGRNVKLARKTTGLSQEAFADVSGIARSYMSDVERGARNPTLEVVERIAQALKTPAHHLLDPEFQPEQAEPAAAPK
jgi:transcriptional regulator with XRE-family HTH domain